MRFAGKVEPKENNKVQMLLYQAVLQYSMGMDHRKVKAYLLYTRYPLHLSFPSFMGNGPPCDRSAQPDCSG